MAEKIAHAQELESPQDSIAPLKLNLGSGDYPLKGYVNLDAVRDEKIFPLEYVNAVDEIRASHVLEHFPHGQVARVLENWVAALKPGGVLKIAVPDFRIVAEAYLKGTDIPVQSIVMGGQNDRFDFHGVLFDAELLHRAMLMVGLRGITRWHSEVKDCASLPFSLNLMGVKPVTERPKTCAVMSVPRLGFMDNNRAMLLLPQMGIAVRKATGAFWGQCLTRAIEESIAEHDPEFVITIDYDSLFTADAVDALIETAVRNPHAHAIAAVQINRNNDLPLFTVAGPDGKAVPQIDRDKLEAELLEVRTAHFGLTLLRTSAIKAMPKPWFMGIPDAEGNWSDARVDDDIHFWQQWRKAGFGVFMAMRVPIGHIVESAIWPSEDLTPLHQNPRDFWKGGPPEGVWK